MPDELKDLLHEDDFLPYTDLPKDILPNVVRPPEFSVARDFEAEISKFEEIFTNYEKQRKSFPPKWLGEKSQKQLELENEVFDAIPSFHPDAKRNIVSADKLAYIQAFWKHRQEILQVWKDLDVLSRDAHALNKDNCTSIVSASWKSLDNAHINFDDYPTEEVEYVCLLNEVLETTLDVITKFAVDLPTAQRTEVAKSLKSFVLDNSRYTTLHFDRIEMIAESILDIEGIDGLQDVKDVIDYLDSTRLSYIDEEQEILQNAYYIEFDESDHYNLHRNLVEYVGSKVWSSVEKPQVVNFLCSFMEKDSAGSLYAYSATFQQLGVEVSVEPLLKNLRNPNLLARRMSAEILFRLELGKVGVTPEGVEYLGKLYDLGTLNDPDFFVRRLNNSGLMAVLGQEGSIEGVFPLDLLSEEKIVIAEIRYLMSEELFLPKADETPAQRNQREEYLRLFVSNYEAIFSDNFFVDTPVLLSSLDLHEQGWFVLTYLRLTTSGDTAGLGRLKSFVQNYGEYGLKAFLVLDYGGSTEELTEFVSNPDLSLDEKLTVFKNFNAICTEALNWREVFGEVENGTDYQFSAQVHEALIRKNAEFFRAAQVIARGNGGDVTMPELVKNMGAVAYSLRSLEQLYSKNSSLNLVQMQPHDEYDSEGNIVKGASNSYILEDAQLGVRIVVFIRPNATIRRGEVSGGEARINFSVTDLHTKDIVRVGVDLSDYGAYIGDAEKKPVVSLDLGVGKPDKEAGIWPTQRVGRVLGLVPESEGGHNELSFKPEVAQHFPEIAKRFDEYIRGKFVRRS
jgi:hypothetical protein